jgi:hypothetical protein
VDSGDGPGANWFALRSRVSMCGRRRRFRLVRPGGGHGLARRETSWTPGSVKERTTPLVVVDLQVQRPPDRDALPAPVADLGVARVRRRKVLHGLINEYEQAA